METFEENIEAARLKAASTGFPEPVPLKRKYYNPIGGREHSSMVEEPRTLFEYAPTPLSGLPAEETRYIQVFSFGRHSIPKQSP